MTHAIGPARDAPVQHPLEMIALFRRWPSSPLRNVVYTGIWNLGLAVCLTGANLAFGRRGATFADYWWPMLLICNLIGYLIHLGTLAGDRLLGGWPRRARGLPQLAYRLAITGGCALLGYALGFTLLGGGDPLHLLVSRQALTQVLPLAVFIALFMLVVHLSGERRIAAETHAARQREQLEASARQLAEARLRALQAQIEPHFLYNTLANVVSLIAPQPAQATHMLERFIDYLRASLAASREEAVTLGADANLIAAYLDVLAVRMGERLRYRIDVPDDLRAVVIAPMLLQPLVENAVAHGLEPKVEGGEIVLAAMARDGRLCVEVRDTGVGLSDTGPVSVKRGGGVGLGNLRERLRTLYGDAARVELLENQPCGMTVRLLLPLNGSPPSTTPAP
ncbi:sensor histidine kinase [Duganella sp. LX20W]|uniref:Sensor histidine kinase n=1 Tax=Rugamonas brunnea TaxID=2758569 RepID=A0A7W2ICA5_9BURK|nr:sensor histidine kinase [Rugamonas brunnea]MBA5638366.1 sensor histidine kinase [Rugamonas brunnea]